ncbi:TIGR00304 family membrane protein [Archaeoglobus neptunius]|uniref:TIGR00304 family membrane protein n=1 Tax=Archaeoglobus neptunius TaxID=2798580 RepID=UPI00192953F0|nr:TIGR00304 family protein [Archaeoglobus neptunius]
MIKLLAVTIILLGLYLIVSGLKERIEFEDVKEEYEAEEFDDKERRTKREVKGGGVILIGPIPIVFGDSKYATLSLILAIILMVISILFILLIGT